MDISKIKRGLTGTFAALALAFGSTAAIGQEASQALSSESVIETIKQRGVIKVGLSTFAPWSMRDKQGELIGFEIDVANELAKDMGVEVEYFPTQWDGIIPALLSGKFDVIISSMTRTPSRNLTINFTEPYTYSGLTIMANKQMTEGFSFEDYNSSEVTFAARRASTAASVISTLFPEAQLLQFDENTASTQEVLNGRAHATMHSGPQPHTDARTYPDTLYVPFDKVWSAQGESFGVRKGDPDALAYFNTWIGIKSVTGWMKERNDFWMKTVDWKDQVSE